MRSATAAAVALAACSITTSVFADVVIGVAVPTSGAYAQIGEALVAGAELAAERLDAAGGVAGETVRVVVQDDACDPVRAVDVARAFIAEGVAAVIGHPCSGAAIAAADLYAEAGLVAIVPMARAPELTTARAGKTVFRLAPRDDAQGGLAGAFLADVYPDGDVAFVSGGRGAGDEAILAAAARAFEEAGVPVPESATLLADGSNADEIAGAIAAANSGAVFVSAAPDDTARLLLALREAGSEAEVVGTDDIVSDVFLEIAGDMAEGVMATFPIDPRPATPAGSRAAFEAAAIPLGTAALSGFAAVEIWAQASDAAGGTEPATVAPLIAGGSFETGIGEVAFDENGDAIGPGYGLVVYQDGIVREM